MKLVYVGRYDKVAVTRPDDTREVVGRGRTFTTTGAHAAALLEQHGEWKRAPKVKEERGTDGRS